MTKNKKARRLMQENKNKNLKNGDLARSEGFISLNDAADLCSYSQDYLSLLARKGNLKSKKFGRNWYTRKEWLEEYIHLHPADKKGNVKGVLLDEVKKIKNIDLKSDLLVKFFRVKIQKAVNVLADFFVAKKVKSFDIYSNNIKNIKNNSLDAIENFYLSFRKQVINLLPVFVALILGGVLVLTGSVQTISKNSRIALENFGNEIWQGMNEITEDIFYTSEAGVKFLQKINFEKNKIAKSVFKNENEKIISIDEKWESVDLINWIPDQVWDDKEGIILIGTKYIGLPEKYLDSVKNIYNTSVVLGDKTQNRILGLINYTEKWSKEITDKIASFKYGKEIELVVLNIKSFSDFINENIINLFGSIGNNLGDKSVLVANKIGDIIVSPFIMWLDYSLQTQDSLVELAKRNVGSVVIEQDGEKIITKEVVYIKGEKGDPGIAGPQGLQGEQGEKGETGNNIVNNVYNIGTPGSSAKDGAGTAFATKYLSAQNLDVTNATTLNTLTVSGGASFESGVGIAGNTIIGGDLNVSGGINQSGSGAAFATTTITGDFTVQDAESNAHIYVQNNTGYVGIATTTPDAELDIAGRLSISGYSPKLNTQYHATEIIPDPIDTDSHDAFGIISQFPNGKMVIAYRSGATHAGAGDYGTVDIRISTDQGYTWSSASTIASESGVDLRNIGGGVTPNGRLVIFYSRYNSDDSEYISQGYVYSDDEGATWSDFIETDVGSDIYFSFYGGMIEIGDGKLMQSWYAWDDSSPVNYSVYVFFSTDNGKTWGNRVTVLSDTIEHFTESSFVYLGGGNIIGLSRINSGTTFNQVKSEDNGLTWTNQGNTDFDSWSTSRAAPAWLSVFNDVNGKQTVAAYYLNRTDLKFKVIWGRDLISSGTSGWMKWTRKDLASVDTYLSGYPSVIHPNDDQYGFGWYYNRISDTDADITFFGHPTSTDLILAGNVGVNTIAPTTTFQIVGNFSIATTSDSGFDKREAFSVNSTNSFATTTVKDYFKVVRADELISLFVDKDGNVGVATTTPSASLVVTSAVGSKTGNQPLFLVASTTSDTITNNFVVTANGNVGIATTTPWGYLSVEGQGGATPSFVISDTANNTDFIVISTGDVGIGTYDPQYKLDVNGTGRFSGLLYADAGFYTDGPIYSLSGDLYITNESEDGIIFSTYDSERMRILGGGAIGVNTSTPGGTYGEIFTVDGDAYIEGNATTSGSLYIGNDLRVANSTVLGSSMTDSLTVVSYVASDLIPYQNSYDLGSSDNRWSQAFIDELNVNTLSAGGTDISGTASNEIVINSTNATEDEEDASVVFERGTPMTNASIRWDASENHTRFNFPIWIEGNDLGGNASSSITVKEGADQNGSDLFQLKNISDNLLVQADARGHFAIGSSYQDGYGFSVATTTYFSENIVQTGGTAGFATTTITGNFTVQDSDGTQTLYVDNNDHRVGIGTASPSAKLHIEDTNGNVALQIGTPTAGAIGAIKFYKNTLTSFATGKIIGTNYNNMDWGYLAYTPNSDTNNWKRGWLINGGYSNQSITLAAGTDSGAVIDFTGYTSTSVPKMRIDINSGRVGIATTTPSARLSIQGSGATSATESLRITDSTGNGALMVVQDGGNVGIGTASPSYDLDLGTGSGADLRLGGTLITKNISTASAGSGVYNALNIFANLWPISDSSYAFNIQTYNTAGNGYANKFQIYNGDTGKILLNPKNGGNVGIATTTPFAKLAVHANNDDPYTENLFLIASSTSSATTTHFVVTNDGNVGIGTASPGAKLDVRGTIYVNDPTIHANNLTSGDLVMKYNSGIISSTGTENYYGKIIPFNGSGNMIIQNSYSHSTAGSIIFETAPATNGTLVEAVRIASSGNVGIGTSSPDSLLYLSEATGPKITLYREEDGQINQNDILGTISFGGYGGYDVNDVAFIRAYGDETWGSTSDAPTRLTFWTTPNSSATPVERMQIDRDGFIGMNTTTPWAYLSVEGQGTNPEFVVADADYNTDFIVDASGNVGIGTSLAGFFSGANVGIKGTTYILSEGANQTALIGRYPQESLSIYVDDSNVVLESIQDENSAGYGNMIFRVDDDSTADGYFAFQNKSADEFMRITGAGNVGIATTTPSAKLVIEGDGATSATESLRITDSTGNGALMVVQDGGNVGIGTDSPGTTLDINSSISGVTHRVMSTGNVAYMEFQNAQTGYSSAVNTGLTLGMNSLNAFLLNREAGSLYLGTNDTATNLEIESDGDFNFNSGAFTMDSNGNATSTTSITAKRIKAGGTASSANDTSVVYVDEDNTTHSNFAGLRFRADSNVASGSVYGVEGYARSLSNTLSNVYGGYFWGSNNAPLATSAYGVLGLATTQNANSTTTNTYGVYGYTYPSGDQRGITNAYGLYADVYNIGGYIGTGYGLKSIVHGTSKMGTGYGVYVDVSDTDITTPYGIYIANNTTGYGIYSAATADSYFAGNVGIGNSSPNGKLHVDQDSDDEAIYVDSEATSLAAVRIFGKYGALITQDVSNGYGLYVQRNIADAGGSPLVTFKDDNTSNTQTTLYVQQDGTGDILNLYDGGTEVFTVEDGGEVGIGTSTPLGLLSVHSKSADTTPLFVIASTTPDEVYATTTYLMVNSIGNVGLGTTTPTEQLTITGNVRLAASSATAGVIKIGESNLMHSYGTNNFFAGKNAGNLTNTGQKNVGIGVDALAAITNRQQNTAVGFQSQLNSTSGDFNTSLGSTALYSNTEGSNNTAVGWQALYKNTTAVQNGAFGQNALYSNTTGALNNAFGSNALYSNTTGEHNTGIGEGALYHNTTGNHNTAMGYDVAFSGTIGNNNVYIGYEAAWLNNGSNNLVLGYQAARNVAGLDNNLWINNKSTSTPLIFGDFKNQRIGINTTTPFAKFAIHANNDEPYTENLFVIASSTSVATTTHFVVTNDGNVGIGINIPNMSLEVANNTLWSRPAIGGSSPDNSRWFYLLAPSNSGNYADLVRTSGTSLRFATDSAKGSGTFTTQMTLDSSGLVGINTTSPTHYLTINAASSLTALKLDSYGNTEMRISSSDTNNPYGLFRLQDTETTPYFQIQIGDSAAYRNLVLQNLGGNVGIGTESPSGKLEVVGLSTGGILRLDGGGNSTGSDNYTQISLGWNQSNYYQQFIRSRHNDSPINNAIDFYTNDGTQSGVFPTNAIHGLTITNGKIGVATTTPTASIHVKGAGATSATESLRITDSTGNGALFVVQDGGNVGIGTDSPGFKLDVQTAWGSVWATKIYNSDATTGYGLQVRAGNDSTNKIAEFRDYNDNAKVTILGNGNVGIGTASPSAKLHVPNVSNTSPAPSIIIPDVTNNRYSTGLGSTNVSGIGQRLDFFAGDSGANGTNLTAASIRMSIMANGLVGVGTTTPLGVFSVHSKRGNTTPVFVVASTTPNGANNTTTYMVVDYLGNVGIGKEPSYKLDVNGIVNATAIYENGSPFAGSQWSGNGDDIYYSSGKVAVGSSTPFATFAVHANNDDPYRPNVFLVASSTSAATNTLFVVKNDGKIGIGTLTPSSALEIQDASGVATLAVQVGDSQSGANLFEILDNSSVLLSNFTAAGGLVMNIASTTALNVQNGSDEPVLVVDTSNSYVGIGTSTPTSTFQINLKDPSTNDIVFRITTTTAADAMNTVFSVDEDGDFFYDGSGTSPAADYAEYFYSNDINLVAGELVCVDIENENAVKRCDRMADGNLMGIISTQPAILGNAKKEFENNKNYKIVGMLGQVPAKVSNANGAIRPGDSLTTGETPGVAVRANAGDPTVGIALEGFDGEDGIINVLISRRNSSITVEEVEEQITERIANMEIEDEVNLLIAGAMDELGVDEKVDELTVRVVGLESALATINNSLSNINNSLNIVNNKFEFADNKVKVAGDLEIENNIQAGGQVGASELVLRLETEESEQSLVISDQDNLNATNTDEVIAGEATTTEDIIVFEESFDGSENSTSTQEVLDSQIAEDNSEVKITVVQTETGELALNVNAGAEFMGNVRVLDLIVEGKLIVLGDAEFVNARINGNLDLSGAIIKEFYEAEDEVLAWGDAVYISGNDTVRRVYADDVEFKPAIGLVIGFVEDEAQTSRIVKVAMGGSITGFNNLIAGDRYYLADLMYYIDNTDMLATTTNLSVPASISNFIPHTLNSVIQILGVAKSDSEFLVMPSLNTGIVTEENLDLESLFANYENTIQEENIGQISPTGQIDFVDEETITEEVITEEENIEEEIINTENMENTENFEDREEIIQEEKEVVEEETEQTINVIDEPVVEESPIVEENVSAPTTSNEVTTE